MAGHKLGDKSMGRLSGVHPDLIKVVLRAIEITDHDFMVLEGVRTEQRQRELYGQGRSADDMRAKGLDQSLSQPGAPQVTWTLKSNHFKQADGYGHAVDLVPYPVDWNDMAKFDAIAEAMFKASEELGVRLRWGVDWNQNGKRRERGETDSPHFELGQKGAL